MHKKIKYVLDTNKIIYTKHALRRIYDYGMFIHKIEDTIKTGELKIESKRQNKFRAIKRYGNYAYHIIFRIEINKVIVITCRKVRT